MKVLCVDDERKIAEYTVSLCRKIPQIDEAVSFTRSRDALAWMDEEYKVITEARASRGIDDQILSIIKEEAAAYFAGQKSAADVAGVIQSRVQLYVNENR